MNNGNGNVKLKWRWKVNFFSTYSKRLIHSNGKKNENETKWTNGIRVEQMGNLVLQMS